jgi:hypothetical protein
MRIARAIVLATAIFSCGALSSRGDEMGSTVLAKGLFSYQAPPGWSVQQASFSKYPVSAAPRRNGFAANIDVVIESSPKALGDYVSSSLAAFQSSGALRDMHVVNQRPFLTAAGLDGIRVEATDMAGPYHLREIFYFFDGGSDNKLVVTASCLARDGIRDAPLFDASLKTFTLE